jgi:hypothetical protein
MIEASMSVTPLSLAYEAPRPKPSFWRHPSTLAIAASIVQAPWYLAVAVGLGLMRLGQAKSALIDGAIATLSGVPSVVAIALGLLGMYRWRSARWIIAGALFSAVAVLCGGWMIVALWQEFSADVLHSSDPNWGYL